MDSLAPTASISERVWSGKATGQIGCSLRIKNSTPLPYPKGRSQREVKYPCTSQTDPGQP